MDNLIQNALNEENKIYRSGPLKGLCLKGFEDLDIRSIPFDKPVREYNGFYRLLKRTRSRSIVSFDFTTGGVTHRIYAKRYRVWRLAKRLAYLFIPSKCLKEWRLGFSLLKKGIMTPLPLIAAEYRAGPFVQENYLVTRGIEPFESLNHILKNMPDQKTKRDILAGLAHFIRDVHDRGFYHDDISLNHIFTHANPGEDRQYALIDLDNSRLMDKLPQRMIARNLFQLFHSSNASVWPYEERLVFLEFYLGSRPSRDLIEKINAQALRKTGGALF